MTVFYGARDELDLREPRPYWQIAKDMLGLVLVAVNSIVWPLLIYAFMLAMGV